MVVCSLLLAVNGANVDLLVAVAVGRDTGESGS
jgi:hypothetical protein